MLRKEKILVICLLIYVGMAGCQSDLLDTVPNDRISSAVFWETIEDAEAATNAVYETLDGVDIVEYDGVTDHLITNVAFAGDNFDIQRGIMDSGTGRFADEWEDAYQGIRRANDVMANIDQIEDADTDAINVLKAEAMTIRAYHYIKLVMLFGDVPLITTPINIEEGLNVTRTAVSQIWDFIDADLGQAVGWLPWDNGSRISKGTAMGLHARAMLYAGRYGDAENIAGTFINDPSNPHSLHPDYYELFQYEGQNNAEVLLDREYASGINSHNVYSDLAPYSQIQGQTGSAFVPTAALVDLYEMDNGLAINEPGSGFDEQNPYQDRDPRLYASVFLNGVTELPDGNTYSSLPPGSGSPDDVELAIASTKTGYNVRKYVDPEDYGNPGNSGLNIILMRYAEVLLTYAEAKIELDDIDQSVYDAINEVRQRLSVNMPAITNSGQSQSEMRDIVRNERAVELAFEGFRLFDIRRWSIAEDVMVGIPLGARYDDGGTVVQVEVTFAERSFDANRDYLWPIPVTERTLNPNLTQNPNW